MRDGFPQEENSRRHDIAAGRQTIADVARGSSARRRFACGIAPASIWFLRYFTHIRRLASPH
jgi:hypothetical protein